jgi:hypothetical protein
MAVSLEWPSNLPVPILSGYSLNQQTGLITSEFSTGRIRARKLSNRPSVMKCTWRVKDSEAELFETALEEMFLGNSFLMTAKLPRMDRLQKVEALITKDPRDSRKPASNAANRWEYTGEILIKSLPNLDKEVFSLVMDMNITLNNAMSLLDVLEDMLN